MKFVVYKETDAYSNLINGSKRLYDEVFVRRFISDIMHLEYISFSNPLKFESVSNNYVPTTNNNPWRPWHHVYSACKGGKGHKHNPQTNKLGK